MVVGTIWINVPALWPNLIMSIGFILGLISFSSVVSTSFLSNLLIFFDHKTSKQWLIASYLVYWRVFLGKEFINLDSNSTFLGILE